MPVIGYAIWRLDPDGWSPVERFAPEQALAADRTVDALRRERPGVYRLWLYTTQGARLLRDTAEEESR